MSTEFHLHPKLLADTSLVAELPLSRLLLMNDSQYSWLILVPRLMAGPTTGGNAYIRDLSDVPPEHHAQLWGEIMAVERALRAVTGAYKMNTAALANVVQQLHIHVIARFETDPAWPGSVWGKHPTVPYQPSAAGQLIARVKSHLHPVFPNSF